jgi:adenosylcobyric acid synthase
VIARTIMVQGTASSVGKSLVAAALCRYFVQEGLRVAPFKSQNMALNSFVTPEGGEIGRAQAVQAEAARVAPHVDMNPVLLKPEGDARSQVVVLGKPLGSMSAREYHAKKPDLKRVIAESLSRLRETHDLIVIEGAGSPAEINLKDRDIVNMHVARIADAPVLLVGDIDRGGVFAAFVGTLELLEPEERARVAGFVINKFRGDVGLLTPGLDYLTGRTGIPVAGVLPYVPRLRMAEEDSVSLDHRSRRPRAAPGEIEIAVVRFPRISNYDDFEPLEHEPGVVVRFVDRAEEARGADLLVLPGTKSTMSDLAWLRASGIAKVVTERAARGEPLLGVCGGCQMLGARLEDPFGVESPERDALGLGLLPVRTRFAREKTTAQVRARAATGSFVCPAGTEITGYEIHMGQVTPDDDGARCSPAFTLTARNGAATSASDGAVASDGVVVGTLIHGLFESEPLRRAMLGSLRARKGVLAPPPPPPGAAPLLTKQGEFDRLAAVIRAHMDRALLARFAGLAP